MGQYSKGVFLTEKLQRDDAEKKKNWENDSCSNATKEKKNIERILEYHNIIGSKTNKY